MTRRYVTSPARGLYVARIVRGLDVVAVAIESTLELAAKTADRRAQEAAA